MIWRLYGVTLGSCVVVCVLSGMERPVNCTRLFCKRPPLPRIEHYDTTARCSTHWSWLLANNLRYFEFIPLAAATWPRQGWVLDRNLMLYDTWKRSAKKLVCALQDLATHSSESWHRLARHARDQKPATKYSGRLYSVVHMYGLVDDGDDGRNIPCSARGIRKCGYGSVVLSPGTIKPTEPNELRGEDAVELTHLAVYAIDRAARAKRGVANAAPTFGFGAACSLHEPFPCRNTCHGYLVHQIRASSLKYALRAPGPPLFLFTSQILAVYEEAFPRLA
ncbi:hypothetical protein BKA62DRAFT_757561 [Auriculariales sp. MPI-PUGE-AT-0066]|nr:hypothetical protein BKA62DRAFT_757561 [Auriculariales sp. MPI-PUGE-AT-0066]